MMINPVLLARLSSSQQWRGLRQVTATISALTLSLSLWVNPAAADPFRANNPRAVGAKTEAAFDALFEQGNYRQAAELLQTAEPNEPLAYAMKSALAYINQDWNTMGSNARLTRETAEKLVQTDPLRGHIYTAAGHFLEGAYTLSTQNAVTATPTVLAKLQQVFDQLKQAEQIDANDPELNLLKGYMDLMLAVNLPFSNPEEAIARLKTHAQPAYLAQRGIAIGYRDLDQPDPALEAVKQAITATPDNPELFYLQAQILRLKGGDLQGNERRQVLRQSVESFKTAWAKRSQLPDGLVSQLQREYCRTFHESRTWDPNRCTASWQPPAR